MIIAYTRDPFAAAPSLYTENLKFGLTETFENWLATQGRTMADHDRLLDRWRGTDATLHTERIDELSSAGIDIVAHFCGLLDIAVPATTPGPTNSRISYQEALALFYCNNIFKALSLDLPPARRRQVHHHIRRTIRKEMKADLTPYGLTETETLHLREMFGEAGRPTPRLGSDFELSLQTRARLTCIVREAVFDEVIAPKTAPLEAFQPAPSADRNAD